MAKEALGTSTRGKTEDADKNSSQTFDLQSWQGLTEVLKVARESELEDEAYATFRDLVLQYAQSKGDTELKAKIDAYIKTFKTKSTDALSTVADNKKDTHAPNTAVSQKKASTDASVSMNEAAATEERAEEASSHVQSVHTNRRPTPTFSVADADVSPAQDRHSSSKSELTPSREAQIQHTQFVPDNLPTEDVAVKRPRDEVEAPQPQEKGATSSEDVAAKNESRSTEAAPTQKRQSRPTEQEAPASPEVSSKPEDIETHKARIAEIKKDVNSRAGNPITLIDSGNPIGRTYMSALLAAMKATAGGKRGALAEKMAALESAYTEVIDYLESRGEVMTETSKQSPEPELAQTQTEPVPAASTTEQAPEAASADEVPQTKEQKVAMPIAAKKPKQSAPAPELDQQPVVKSKSAEQSRERRPGADMTDASADDIQAELETTIEAISVAPEKRPEIPKAPNTEVSPEVAQVEEHSPQAEVSAEHAPAQPEGTPREPTDEQRTTAEHAEADVTLPINRAQQPKQNLAPHIEDDSQSAWDTAPNVRRDAHPNTEEEIKSISDMVDRVTAAQSELKSTEVTEGLNQLLEQWDLFKKSGLLGMGPGGSEHPLYKQLSVLPMSEVVSGRWEGATRENIKILKDYINAWRNEQGITYNQNETFEHYLRRVVQRVLKRQNVSV